MPQLVLVPIGFHPASDTAKAYAAGALNCGSCEFFVAADTLRKPRPGNCDCPSDPNCDHAMVITEYREVDELFFCANYRARPCL